MRSVRGQCYYVHCMVGLFRTEYGGADSTPKRMGMINLETSCYDYTALAVLYVLTNRTARRREEYLGKLCILFNKMHFNSISEDSFEIIIFYLLPNRWYRSVQSGRSVSLGVK